MDLLPENVNEVFFKTLLYNTFYYNKNFKLLIVPLYEPIKSNKDIIVVYNLLFKDKLPNSEDLNEDVVYYLCIYYLFIGNINYATELLIKNIDQYNHLLSICLLAQIETKKNNLMKGEQLYLRAFENGCLQSLTPLIDVYDRLNYVDSMNKYISIATEKNIGGVFNYLACSSINNTLIVEYYMKAINLGNIDAMYNLARYYKDLKDYDQMIFYFNLAVKHEDVDSMYNLAKYYFKYNNIDKALYYYELILKTPQICSIKYKSIFFLLNYYSSTLNDDIYIEKCKSILNLLTSTNIEKFIISQLHLNHLYLLKSLFLENSKLLSENVELKYRPDGQGYLETKEHFESCAKLYFS